MEHWPSDVYYAYASSLLFEFLDHPADQSDRRAVRAALWAKAILSMPFVCSRAMSACKREGLGEENTSPPPPKLIRLNKSKPLPTLPSELVEMIFDASLASHDRWEKRQAVRMLVFARVDRHFREWATQHRDAERLTLFGKSGPRSLHARARALDVHADISKSADNLVKLIAGADHLTELRTLFLEIESKRSHKRSSAKKSWPFGSHCHLQLILTLPSRPLFFPHLTTLSLSINVEVLPDWLYRLLTQTTSLETLRLQEMKSAQSLPWSGTVKPPACQLKKLVCMMVDEHQSDLLSWILSTNEAATCEVVASFGYWPCVSIDTISAASIRELSVGWPLYACSELWQSMPNVTKLRIFQCVLPDVSLALDCLRNMPLLETLCLGIMSRGLSSVRKDFPPFSTRDNLVKVISSLGLRRLEVDDEKRTWTLTHKLALELACAFAGTALEWKKIGSSLSPDLLDGHWQLMNEEF